MSVFESEPEKPAEDLAMIRRLMEQSYRVVFDAAGHYIAWGVLVTVGLLLTWTYTRGMLGLGPAVIWPVTIGAGWVFSMWFGYRQDRRRRVRSPGGRVLTAIWVGCGVAMTLLGFVGGGTGVLSFSALMAAEACVMGVGYFASAAVFDGTWPRIVGGGWWAAAVLIFLWPGSHTLLVMAGLMVALHLVPGILVHRAAGADDRPVARTSEA